MHRILIVDASAEFCEKLAALLPDSYEVTVCNDGLRALAILGRLRPDAMVLDPMLPGLDGGELLRLADERGICPRTVVVSRFLSEHLLDRLGRYPVANVLRKPCRMEAVVNEVRELLERPALTPHDRITSMLHSLGISTKHAGFRQIRAGIMQLSANPGLAVTKVVYPEIADRDLRPTNARAVERNIRTAIAHAYARRDDRIWRRYFQPATNGEIPKPTNAQFLTRLAEEISQTQPAKP